MDELTAFPMPRSCPFDPPAELANLRAERPVSRVRLWDGSSAWIVTRHADARQAFADSRLSADASNAGYPHVSAGSRAGRTMAPNIMVTDDPLHRRLRDALAPEFSLKSVELRCGRILEIIDAQLDRLAGLPRPLDLLQHFAQPIPSQVICDILGVPYEDNGFCLEQLSIVLHVGSTLEESRRANRRLLDYLDSLLDSKDRELGQDDAPVDLIGRLVVEQFRTGLMTREEILANVRQLIFAGQDSTANTLALGVLFLLQNPALLRQIQSDPEAQWPKAVEEIVRLTSVTHQGRRRVAVEDLSIGGQLVRAGEGVIIAENSANRDESAFPDAARMDLQRENARQHVGFGFGAHHCLGAALARSELRLAMSRLFDRIPALTLAVPVEQLRFRHDMTVYGVYELPVTW